MITEDYVSFETAKLLREKGFNIYGYASIKVFGGNTYEVNGEWITPKEDTIIPTLQMAMKWLRKVHNLHIEVHYNTFWDYYQYTIFYYDRKIESDMAYHSFENAAETAIKYCLKKLI